MEDVLDLEKELWEGYEEYLDEQASRAEYERGLEI